MTKEEYQYRLNMPLEHKIKFSVAVIEQWLQQHKGRAYVAYSAGIDSTILLDLVRKTDPWYYIPAVFADTGLEFPEIRDFAKKQGAVFIKPRKNNKTGRPWTFYDVIRVLQHIRPGIYPDRLRFLHVWNYARGAIKI